MKRLFGLFALLALCSCTIIGQDLKDAIQLQTHYTRQYVLACPSSDEQIKGIGERLIVNCDKLDQMVK